MATNCLLQVERISLAENLKVLRLADPSADGSGLNVKHFTKLWVTFTSKLPGEGSLQFYNSKSAAKHMPPNFIENLAKMTNIQEPKLSKKQHALKLLFADHVLFILFSSLPTLHHWHKRLRTFLNCYPLFLLKCPQQPHRTGHYILCFSNRQIIVYCTHTYQLKWIWNLCHLRRYRFDMNVPFIEIEAGRSSATGEGNFFFTGNGCSDLFNLLRSLSESGRTQPSQPSHTALDESSDHSYSDPNVNSTQPEIGSNEQEPTLCKLRKMPNKSLSDGGLVPHSLPVTGSNSVADLFISSRQPAKLVSLSTFDSDDFPKEYCGARSQSIPHAYDQITSHMFGSVPCKTELLQGADDTYTYVGTTHTLPMKLASVSEDFSAIKFTSDDDDDGDDDDGYVNADDDIFKIPSTA